MRIESRRQGITINTDMKFDSNVAPLCLSVISSESTTCTPLGIINKFWWAGEFANMKSTYNQLDFKSVKRIRELEI